MEKSNPGPIESRANEPDGQSGSSETRDDTAEQSTQVKTGAQIGAESASRPNDGQPDTDFDGYRDPDLLETLYVEYGLTTREIADRLNCSNGTVSRWLDRFDIETRANWTAGVEAARRANRVERVKLRQLPAGYEYWHSKEWEDGDRVTKAAYVHRLLAVAEHGFDAVADTQVHHKNGIPWDNRAENIELLSAEEHGRLHSQEYWDAQEVTSDA